MSGPIRQYLGPAKARLKQALAKITPPPSPLVNQNLPLEDNITNLKAFKQNLYYEKEAITQTVTAIDTKNTEWAAPMQRMSVDDRKVEEELYNKIAEAPDSFVAIWGIAETKIVYLTALEQEIKSAIQELKQQQQTTSMMAQLSTGETIQQVPTTMMDTTMTQMDPTTGMTSMMPATMQTMLPHVRLPKLQMSLYAGDPLQWDQFWDTYVSSVHVQPIQSVQKLTYLRSLLKGEALRAIEGLAVNNANYDAAIDILQKRFGSKDLIKNMLYSNLRKLRPVRTFNIPELRTLIDTMDKILHQLKALGENLDHPSLVGLILEKLPPPVIIHLEEQYKSTHHNDDDDDPPWSLDSLQAALAKLVSVHEKIDRMSHFSTPLDGTVYRHSYSSTSSYQTRAPRQFQPLFRPPFYSTQSFTVGTGVRRMSYTPRRSQSQHPPD